MSGNNSQIGFPYIDIDSTLRKGHRAKVQLYLILRSPRVLQDADFLTVLSIARTALIDGHSEMHAREKCLIIRFPVVCDCEARDESRQ